MFYLLTALLATNTLLFAQEKMINIKSKTINKKCLRRQQNTQ